MKRDAKPEIKFPTGGPYVDPSVAGRNPAAASYARQIAERMGGEPRGGAPVPIPPLNMPHQPGMTMADQAAQHRPQPGQPFEGGIVTPFSVDPAQAVSAAAAQGRALLTSDLLPEAAKQDPMWQEGHGSMYAVNQPHLAQKYGVIRNGQFVAPQQLQTGKPGLKTQTVEGLKALQDFNQQRMAAATGDTAAERAAEAGPVGLGNTAQLAGESSAPVTDVDRRAAEEALQKMDEFDFNAFREIMMKDLLNNDEQRVIVEDRLSPLDISDLIVNGRIVQLIPIRPRQYEPELQSLTGEDELALKRLLMEDRKNLGAPDRYLLDKYNFMTIACALRAINGTVLLDYHNEKGEFDDRKFWAKFNQVLRMPFHMLASIGVHYYWFDVRVRKLFVAEKIKNG